MMKFKGHLRMQPKSDFSILVSRIAQQVVLKLDLHDDEDKRKAMMAVSSLLGIQSIAVDMKEKKLTVVGDADPVAIVSKLRKLWHPEILSVGPYKEEKKKEEPKKDVEKKKRDEEMIAELIRAYGEHNPYQPRHYEDPAACVIC